MLYHNTKAGEMAADLVAALGELADVKRGASANIPTKSGGSYSYKYATLPDILQAVRPVLAKHNLAVLQNATQTADGSVAIWTMLVHSSGQHLVFEALPMPMGAIAQETGSAITYGRRYQLLAVLGLAADDDDDGASAAPRPGGQRGPAGGLATQAQRDALTRMFHQRNLPAPDFDGMTKAEASALFDKVKATKVPAKGDKLTQAEMDELRRGDAEKYDLDEEPF